MGVELQDAEIGKRRRQHLDHGDGRRMIAAQHERQEPRTPPGGHGLARGVELLAGRRAVGHLAIAEVAERQVLEVAGQDGGIGLDRVRGQAEVERTAVGPLAEVHAPLEGDAENADAGLGERPLASDERG